MKDSLLKAKSNYIGVAIILFLAASTLLRLLASFIISASVPGATMQNPIGVAQWLAQLISITVSVISLLLPWLFLKFAGHMPQKSAKLGFNIPSKNELLCTLGLFFLITMVMGMLAGIIDSVTQLWFGEKLTLQAAVLPQGGVALFLSFISHCIVPAFLEELLFRGTIQASLTSGGQRFAVLSTSIIFTFLHFTTFSNLPGVFVMSVCIGYIAIITGSYILPIILHFANNFVSFIILYANQNLDGTSALAMSIIACTIYLAWGIIVIYYLHTNKKQLPKLSYIPNQKNKKSRFEIMMTSPFFALAIILIIIVWVIRMIWG